MKSRDHEYEDDDDGEDVEEKEEVLSSCTTCNGYYGPSFGEPVCATCHAFLYADDLDPEGVRDLSSEAGGEDRDSGNEEPNDDFPAHDTNNNTNRNNININHSLNNSNGGAVVYGFSPRVEALNQVRLGDGGPLDELPPEVLIVIFSYLDDISLYAVGNVSHRWNSLLSRISSEKWQVYTQRRWPLFVPFASIQDWYAVYSALIESSYCLTCIYQMTEVIPADNNSLPLRWKRLGHDLRNFSQHPLEGIRAQPLDSSYYHWQASITGPVGSPYEGGIFFLYLKVPFTYPFDPPKVRFLSRIFHPNISRHGDVGIDLIQENNWSSSLTIPKVLISIQSLLTDPYCDICMEPRIGSLYRTDRKKFDEVARLWTWKYAIHDAIPPKKHKSMLI
uniref:E2 ubiquitin-conjugating enzyme n=1 Tax=Lepeophtheirus salmonis TaxID=72036 RepID=C1BV19_LEPSM|nr:Ubiquitin-conjugating enzyme E2-17 kDa [Lepeophtheirus salmonis]